MHTHMYIHVHVSMVSRVWSVDIIYADSAVSCLHASLVMLVHFQVVTVL